MMNRFLQLSAVAVTVMSFLSSASAAETTTAPLYTLTIQSGSTKAISYRTLKGSTKIDFRGTPLSPSATGIATIKSGKGSVQVDASFDKLEPATKFGAEYLTYVLWAVSPEGRATNLGEVIVKDGKSRMKVSTQLQAFGLIVTAEPYFAVTQVSNVVVLENAVRKNTKGQFEEVTAQYDLLQRGQYTVNMNPADLQPVKQNPKIPFYLYQARNAVKIARASGADTLAPEPFKKADALLLQAEDNLITKKNVKMVPQIARESIQTAEDARIIAVKRAADKVVADKLTLAAGAVKSAEDQRTSALKDVDTAKAEAMRAQLAAEAALAEAGRSKSDADTARASALKAEAIAAQAEADKAQLRDQLRSQFNAVLETRDSARGLIINMSDVLFATGKSDLKGPVREKLAKVAGIVMGQPGLKLTVEGHTDNVGSDAFNQTLSEKRADAVRTYLIEQGIKSDTITSKGLGKTSPMTSNESADGRRQNRRVEIVVSGDQIGNGEAAPATNPQ